jgi:hypothetical protein
MHKAFIFESAYIGGGRGGWRLEETFMSIERCLPVMLLVLAIVFDCFFQAL